MKRPRFIFISDNVPSGPIGFTRYIAPYTLASSLESQGFECVVIDYFSGIPDFTSYISRFLTEETVAVAISSTFLSPEKSENSFPTKAMEVDYFSSHLCFGDGTEAKQWFLNLKLEMSRKSPRARILVGGAKAVFFYNRARAGLVDDWMHSVDYFVMGLADQAISVIARSILQDDEERLPLALKSPVKFISSSDIARSEDVPVAHFQKTHAIQPSEWLPIELKRGCAFACKFCHYDKNVSTFKDVARVQSEMLRNYELFGVTGYHFCDDCYNDNYDKVLAFSRMFSALPFNLEWVSYARVDMFWRYPDLIDAVLDSGARGLFLGIETLHHPAGLKAGKGLHPDKVKETLRRLKERARGRCPLVGSFILGLPGETEESLYRTLDWLKTENVFDGVQYGILTLAPPEVIESSKSVIDFSEFSRNPEKYGIRQSLQGKSWAHETMTFEQSVRMHEIWKSELKEIPGTGTNTRTVFCYPRIRSLGYGHDEAVEIQRNPLSSDIVLRNKKWTQSYHSRLLAIHSQI